MEPSLYKAYQQAVYTVNNGKCKIQIKVGVNSIQLDELLITNNAQSAIFITGFNPKSQILSKQENLTNNLSLKGDIALYGLSYLEGDSTDESGSWPKEECFFVFDMNLARAQKLAQKFNQNAFLSVLIKQPVQLVRTLE
jgi:hypothetical protein